MEELNCDTAFTIPLFGGIKISESVAVTWIIMAVLVIVAFILTRTAVCHIRKESQCRESGESSAFIGIRNRKRSGLL